MDVLEPTSGCPPVPPAGVAAGWFRFVPSPAGASCASAGPDSPIATSRNAIEASGPTPGSPPIRLQDLDPGLDPGRPSADVRLHDEDHLAVAFGVSVGRFAGLLQAPRLVGLDSGGGIRTRDL